MTDKSDDAERIEVFRADDSYEVQSLCSLLDEQRVAFRVVTSEEDHHNSDQAGGPWGKIYVREGDERIANRIVQAFRKASYSSNDGDTEDDN